MNISLISNVAKSICSKGKSFDILDDIKSEITIALIEGEIVETVESMTRFAWRYYRKEMSTRRGRVYLNFDLLLESPVYMKSHLKTNGNQRGLYNIRLVETVYELRAKLKTFKEIGEEIGISRCWANLQVTNTLHLPFVSTYLKNKSFEATKILNGRRSKHPSGTDFSISKLTDEKVAKLRKLHRDGMSYSEIAKIFNISRPTAWSAGSGRTWKHVL